MAHSRPLNPHWCPRPARIVPMDPRSHPLNPHWSLRPVKIAPMDPHSRPLNQHWCLRPVEIFPDERTIKVSLSAKLLSAKPILYLLERFPYYDVHANVHSHVYDRGQVAWSPSCPCSCACLCFIVPYTFPCSCFYECSTSLVSSFCWQLLLKYIQT